MSGGGSAADARVITGPFLALATATLAFFVAAGVVLPIAPLFVENELGADRIGVGVSIASFSIAALLLRPLVGWSSDRFGRRPLLIGGSLINVGALALHLFATDLPLFIAARALLGAAEGFYFVAALAAGSDLAPPTRRGEALSFLTLSLYLGIAIGPPIGERLLAASGYPAVWIGATIVAAVAAGLSWLVPETAPNVVRGGPRPRTPLIHPAGIFPGIIILFGLWGMAGLLTFIPAYAREVGLSDAGGPLAVYALLVVGLRVVGARWPDRFGAARLSGIALALSAVGLALLGLASSPVALYVGVLVFGSGVAFTMPALLTVAVARVPEGERGTVVGTTTLFLDIVFGTAPVALGAIADGWGYGSTFLVSAALAAVASLLLVLRRNSLAIPAPVASS
jgi:MFS family permease